VVLALSVSLLMPSRAKGLRSNFRTRDRASGYKARLRPLQLPQKRSTITQPLRSLSLNGLLEDGVHGALRFPTGSVAPFSPL
jgi:hypothetical protein